MPAILEKRVAALKRSGKSESSAWAIATSSLQKEGKLKKGTRTLTKKKSKKRKKK